MKDRSVFDYSFVSDIINHINSYLWERGFGQDPKSSSYLQVGKVRVPIRNCLLIDFDGVRNLRGLRASFKKK